MPAKSAAQKRLMDAAAHNPSFAKKVGVPTDVAKDFSQASKGIKFGKSRARPDLQKANKKATRHGKTDVFSKGGAMKNVFAGKESKAEEAKEKKVGKAAYIRGEKAEGESMKKMKKMAAGGEAMGKVKTAAPSRDGVASKGKTKGKQVAMKKGGMCK